MLTMRSVIANSSFTLHPLSFVAALLLLSIPSFPAPRNQGVGGLLQRADRLYDDKTYGAAADAYESALKTGELSEPRKSEAEYRFDEALGKAKRWDRALTEGVAFVQRHRGTLWEARGLYWLGRLYLGLPHQGWTVGKRFVRGVDAPIGKFAQRPVYREVGDQDLRNARDAFEAARTLFPTYRAAGAVVIREEIQLDFDLALVLRGDPSMIEWASRKGWAPPAAPVWRVEPDAAYSTLWAPPKKLMVLFQSAADIAGPDRHQAALALLGRAMWLREYHAFMSDYAVIWKNGKPQRIPYPYESVTPTAALQELLHDPRYEDDGVRDIASLTLAAYLAQDSRPAEAERELTRFLRERPRSPWAVTARRNLRAIRHSEISIAVPDPVQLPGAPARIFVTYRNVGRLRIRIFRLNLPDLYRRRLVPANYSDRMFQVQMLIGPMQHIAEHGSALATQDVEPAHRGDLLSHRQTLALPIKTVGAYLVEASNAGVTAANIVIVSDLALVQKAHRDGVLFFAADARTGAAVPGVKVVAIQSWSDARSNNHATLSHATTGPNGLVTIPYTQAAKEQDLQVRAFAYRGDRYALESNDASRPDEATQPFSVYGLTDRAVYRPGQRLHYRLVVMRRLTDRLKPAPGVRVQVVISDPAGHMILKRQAACGPFGTLHGDLDLGPEAALGQYSASATVGKASSDETQAFQFRVEEYKKPEFEVSVTPVPASVRLGESATVRITARYYFGGAVPNARIQYRVFPINGRYGYRFPHNYDTLYGYSGRIVPSRRSPGQPPVAQGEARTDAQGTATITFRTGGSRLDPDVTNVDYTVVAEVQDASRRVITGSGTVQAVGRELAVTLEARRGYFHTGEPVEVDVAGFDPSNRPLPASGLVTVVSNPNGPKKRSKEVLRQPFRTAADGKGCFTWRPTKAGDYEVTFLTHDSRGQKVVGATDVWVAGPGLVSDTVPPQAELVVERSYYTAGQSAHILLMTPASGCTVLLTREAGSVILEKSVIRVPSRYVELTLPIRRNDSPEITLSVVLVRNRQMYQTQDEIQVPPVSQLASVTVRADRTRYQPGEAATLHLAARDFRGRPLRAELSLGISDASLDYIEGDNFQDIGSNLFTRSGNTGSPDSSLESSFQEFVNDAQPEPGYVNGPNWTLPSGTGLLSEWPGLAPGSLDLAPSYGLRDRGNMPEYNRRLLQVPSSLQGAAGMMRMQGRIPARQTVLVADYQSGVVSVSANAPFNAGATIQRRLGLGQREGAMNAGQVRRLFADTALWAPAVVTDGRGNATLRVAWPDNLTRWRARAVAVGAGGEVGNADATVETKKDLLVRLSAPRFIVERDTLTLSATVQNALPRAALVRVRLKLGSNAAELVQDDPTAEPGAESTRLEKAGDLRAQVPVRRTVVLSSQGFSTPGAASPSLAETTIAVPANGEKRVDWTVRARRPGALPVTVTALSADGSDAMQVSLPVVIHGAERVVTQAGVLHEQSRVELPIASPGAEADPNAKVVVQLQPSVALVALDALPYLIDDPYGCVEQTMSRFLPAIIVKKTLNDLGYDLKMLHRRTTTLRPGSAHPGVRRLPNSPYTAPAAPLDAAASSPAPLPDVRAANSVFSPARLHAVVVSSLERLRAMQHDDGGWGWWAHDASDPSMTAYVIYGLQMARSAGTPVASGLLNRGLAYLRGTIVEEKDPQRRAFEVRVLAKDPKSRNSALTTATGRLFDAREKLSIYAKALLAQALHDLGRGEAAGIVLRNIEDAAHIDADAGTATWDEAQSWWRWYNDPVETHAAVLEAYLAIQPTHPLVPMLVQWLTREREDVHWSSTRETALAVLALADYARAHRELAANYTVTVSCGAVQRTFRVNHDNALLFDGRLTLDGAAVRAGQTLTITKNGEGTLYYAVTSRTFSQEEPLQPVAGDLAVERRYFRLIPIASAPVVNPPIMNPQNVNPPRESPERPNPFLSGQYDLALGVADPEAQPDDDSPAYRRELLAEGDTIASGDLIEVALQLEAKQDLDYLVFEDIKPAGCETVDLQSGEQWEPGVYSNRELRDQKVAFFVDQLAAGSRLLTYRLYAEIPGRFHVLPTSGYAMYAPRVRALSAEVSLRITDQEGSAR